jgi:hypothetical protein
MKQKNIIHSSEIVKTILELDHLLLTTPPEIFCLNHVFLSKDFAGLFENIYNVERAGVSFSSVHFVSLKKKIFPDCSHVYYFIHQTAFGREHEDFQFLKTLARLRSYLFGGRKLIMEKNTFLFEEDSFDKTRDSVFGPGSKIILYSKIRPSKINEVPFLSWAVGLIDFGDTMAT